MEGERKKMSSGGVSGILALIRDSFFFRLSAAMGSAIYKTGCFANCFWCARRRL